MSFLNAKIKLVTKAAVVTIKEFFMLRSIKKIMLTLCCLLMLMCLCACSGKDNDEVNNNDVNLNHIH